MKKLLLALLLVLSAPAFAADRDSAYDRVMKTQTIRCGYGVTKPWIYNNLETNEMIGPMADITREIAAQTGLKLEWPEETGWGNLPTSLYTGRVDVACSPMWVDPMRGREVAYTRPVFYMASYAYAREDDNRFKTMDDINKPDVRIAVVDGDMTQHLAKRYFPKAQIVSSTSNASNAELLLQVTGNKADITFLEEISVSDFNAAQEKKLKFVLGRPLVHYATAYAVGIKEPALKEMLDTAVGYLINSGRLEEITADFRKKYPKAMILPKADYE